jgi:predicted amidohydrolase YtcJ
LRYNACVAVRKEVSGVLSDKMFDHDGLTLLTVSGESFAEVRNIGESDAETILEENPQVIDARGKLVLPAFIDSHAHVLGAARYLLEIDVHEASNTDELADLIRSSPHFLADFVTAGLLNANPWPADERSRISEALDAAFPDRAVMAKSIEHHSAWLNERAWERLDVDEQAVAIGVADDEIRQMRETGHVHGALHEALSESLYDTYTLEERRRTLHQFLDTLPTLGVGGVGAFVGYGTDRAADIRLTMEVADARDDIDLQVWPRTRDIALVRELGLPRIGGCILLDGAIGARTAALSQPYLDEPDNKGILYFTDEEFQQFASECAAANLQLCVHAIGDAAIEQGLKAYEHISGEFDLRTLRPRIDHFCMGTPQQCARAAALGVASGIQPTFDHFWGGEDGAYSHVLGIRTLTANPLRSAIAAGMILGGGSDAPITPLDPRLGIHAACNHTNRQEALRFDKAVRLFTEGSAAIGREEQAKGKLAPGYQTDFIVMPRETDGSNIQRMQVLTTVHRGRVVYG